MEETARKHGFEWIDISWHRKLSNCIHGCWVEDRDELMDKDTTYMKRGNVLRRLEDAEKMICQRFIDTLLNTKHGVLVIDDDLIASKANVVQTKKKF